MAKVYAYQKFTDPSGETREIGDEFDLPRESDQQKSDFERLLSWGTIGTSEPNTGKSDEDAQRSSPRDRHQRSKES